MWIRTYCGLTCTFYVNCASSPIVSLVSLVSPGTTSAHSPALLLPSLSLTSLSHLTLLVILSFSPNAMKAIPHHSASLAFSGLGIPSSGHGSVALRTKVTEVFRSFLRVIASVLCSMILCYWLVNLNFTCFTVTITPTPSPATQPCSAPTPFYNCYAAISKLLNLAEP